MDDRSFPTEEELHDYFFESGSYFKSRKIPDDGDWLYFSRSGFPSAVPEMKDLPEPIKTEFLDWWYAGKPLGRPIPKNFFKTEVRGLNLSKIIRYTSYDVITSLSLLAKLYVSPDDEEHYHFLTKNKNNFEVYRVRKFFPSREELYLAFKEETDLNDAEIEKHLETFRWLNEYVFWYDTPRLEFVHWWYSEGEFSSELVFSSPKGEPQVRKFAARIQNVTVSRLIEEEKIAPLKAFALLVRLYFIASWAPDLIEGEEDKDLINLIKDFNLIGNFNLEDNQYANSNDDEYDKEEESVKSSNILTFCYKGKRQIAESDDDEYDDFDDD